MGPSGILVKGCLDECDIREAELVAVSEADALLVAVSCHYGTLVVFVSAHGAQVLPSVEISAFQIHDFPSAAKAVSVRME